MELLEASFLLCKQGVAGSIPTTSTKFFSSYRESPKRSRVCHWPCSGFGPRSLPALCKQFLTLIRKTASALSGVPRRTQAPFL